MKEILQVAKNTTSFPVSIPFRLYTHLVKDIISVDTPQDLIAVEQLLREDSWYVEMSKLDIKRGG